jgi:hypothetical protein
MTQKFQPRSSTPGSYPKNSKTMDGWWVDINWRMADIAKLHKSSHIESFFLTNKVTASESNQTFLEANTCQSYIPRIFWKLVRRQIFPQNQTIQKNSLIHGRILLYMGKNPPNKWDRRVPSGKRSHNYGKSPCY